MKQSMGLLFSFNLKLSMSDTHTKLYEQNMNQTYQSQTKSKQYQSMGLLFSFKLKLSSLET